MKRSPVDIIEDLMHERDRLETAIRKALNYRTPMGGSYTQWFEEIQRILTDALDEKGWTK